MKNNNISKFIKILKISGILSIIMSIFEFLSLILIIICGKMVYNSSDGQGLKGLAKLFVSFLWFAGFIILIVSIVELCFGLNALKLQKNLSKIRVIFVLSIIIFIFNLLLMMLLSKFPDYSLVVSHLPFLIKSVVNFMACIYIIFDKSSM